jgi:hypothetical protein
MAQATYEDVNLILRLCELRREQKMREGRQWFVENFKASTPEEAAPIVPPCSQMHTNFCMVTSYGEMVASFITGGVLNRESFFQSNQELLLVRERLRALTPLEREALKSLRMWKNLETVGNACVAFMGHAYAGFVSRVGRPPQRPQQ